MSWLKRELERSRLLDVVFLALLTAAVVFLLTGPATHTAKPAQTPQQQVVSKAPVSPAQKAQDSLSCPPPPGQGVLGACAPKPVTTYGSTGGASPSLAPQTFDPKVCIPDVSSWQGIVDWGAVKSWQQAHGCRPSGIFKMGEYSVDPYAARNNAQLRSLGMWRAGYWFLRNTGCSTEAGQIIAEARALQLTVVIEDDEVPEAHGYDTCLTPRLKAAGLEVAEYASPGAYPGGSHTGNPAWIAAYGAPSVPASPWGGPIKAWQCTDGVYGCVTDVPGIGRQDMSVDYGITSLGVTPTDPNYNPSFNLGYADGESGAFGKGYNADHHPKVIEAAAFNTGYRAGHAAGKAAGHALRRKVPKPATFNSSFDWGFYEGEAAGKGGTFREWFGPLYATPSSRTAATAGWHVEYPKAYQQAFQSGYTAK